MRIKRLQLAQTAFKMCVFGLLVSVTISTHTISRSMRSY